MRFAYLANVRFPSERAHSAQIAHMCQAFAQLGHNVTLYTNARGAGTIEAAKEVFGFTPQFKLQTLPPRHLYGDTKLAFMLREIIFAVSFWWQYKKGSDEVLYSRDEWVLHLLSFLLPRESYVYESHEAKYNRAVRRLVRRGVKLVVISEGIRDYYVRQGVVASQLLVAHDAIDDTFLEPPISQAAARQRLGLPPDTFIAMYIGGFDSWKGVHTFFKAAALLPEVTFVAIGGKPEEVERFRVQYPQVHFLGPRPYKELRYNQQAADVLIIPNSAGSALGAEYTSPLKLFAHLASGVPIVASAVPSVSTVVDERHVTLVTPDDSAALAAAIISVQHQPTANPSFAINAHTWTSRAGRILVFIAQ